EERSGEALRNINTCFIRPLIPVGRTRVDIGNELTRCRVVIDIDEFESVEVGKLSLCSEGVSTAVQVALAKKDPLTEQAKIVFIFVVTVVYVAYPPGGTCLVGIALGY